MEMSQRIRLVEYSELMCEFVSLLGHRYFQIFRSLDNKGQASLAESSFAERLVGPEVMWSRGPNPCLAIESLPYFTLTLKKRAMKTSFGAKAISWLQQNIKLLPLAERHFCSLAIATPLITSP